MERNKCSGGDCAKCKETRPGVMPATNAGQSRRSALSWLLGGGVAASLGSFFYPVVRFLNPPHISEAAVDEVVAGKVQELKPNSGKIVKFGNKPAMIRHFHDKGIPPLLLRGDEIVDLQTFVASLRYFEPTGSSFVGERVFTERGCAHCHGAGAQGTGLGPRLRSGPEALTTVSLTTALWRHSPRMLERAEREGLKWPVLQPTDIGDLVRFLNEPAVQK